jgi:hypothetical protein
MNRGKQGLHSVHKLDAIERHLAGTLRPVVPSTDLLRRLRGRIRIPDRSEIASRLRDWHTLVLILGGVLSGGLVLITLARALFHIVGRRNTG